MKHIVSRLFACVMSVGRRSDVLRHPCLSLVCRTIGLRATDRWVVTHRYLDFRFLPFLKVSLPVSNFLFLLNILFPRLVMKCVVMFARPQVEWPPSDKCNVLKGRARFFERFAAQVVESGRESVSVAKQSVAAVT
eukprot:Selendium_serpulae@DN6181_c1_g4_i6.p1